MGTTHAINWLAGFGDASARTMTAAVGDTLTFSWSFSVGNTYSWVSHNVYLMADQAAFESCDYTAVSYTHLTLPTILLV